MKKLKSMDKNSTVHQLQELVWQAVREFDKNLKIEDIHLEHPQEESHGDYSSNIAMTMFSQTQNSKLKAQNYNLKLKTKKSDFVELLIEIEKMKGDFNFNFMTSHPKDLSDDLIKFLAKSKKWERELHLPLQSGSNRILKLMNRKYDSNQYFDLISKLRSNILNLKITTDIIVGFSTETKKDFEQTLKVLKKIKPKKVYVSQFSSRPNTKASKMKDNVNPKEKKRRWKTINNLYNK